MTGESIFGVTCLHCNFEMAPITWQLQSNVRIETYKCGLCGWKVSITRKRSVNDSI